MKKETLGNGIFAGIVAVGAISKIRKVVKKKRAKEEQRKIIYDAAEAFEGVSAPNKYFPKKKKKDEKN